MHTEQKVGSNWSLRQQNYLPVLLWGPLFVGGPLFDRTCWTCLNPPLVICGHNTISMLCGNTVHCVELSREDLSRHSNKTETGGLRKCPYYDH